MIAPLMLVAHLETAAAGFTQPVQAQSGLHLLVVTGLSGEPVYAKRFHDVAGTLVDAARSRWGVEDSSRIYLAEDPAADPKRITGRATKEGVEAAFAALRRRAAPGDVVLIVLIGHGAQQGGESRLSLPGPDVTAVDFAALLGGLERQTVVFVNAASASGDFVPVLSGPNRVVITATKSAFERNATTFAEHFVRGLVSGDADKDKDGRISVLEAFAYARQEVARAYQSANRLQTEHPQLSDSLLARTVAFGLEAEPGSSDPRVAALQAQRRQLEVQIAELRRRKPSLDSTAYARELERLLVALAEKTAAIRAAREKP